MSAACQHCLGSRRPLVCLLAWLVLLLTRQTCGVILSEHTGPVPEFFLEPPAEFLATVGGPAAANQLVCRLKSGANSDGIKLHWLFEEFSFNSSSDQIVVTANHSIVAGSKAPFVDLGDGRLEVDRSVGEDRFQLPDVGVRSSLPSRYRVYCMARDERTGFVTLSRKTIVRKVSNLRRCRATLNCFSGPAGGVAVCRLQTDPASLIEFFSVRFYRQRLAAEIGGALGPLEPLSYDAGHPKFGIFQRELHIMQLTAEDTLYGYRAEIVLHSQQAGLPVTATYSNLSDPSIIRLLPASASHVTNLDGAIASIAAEFGSQEQAPGGSIVPLPCYSGSGNAGLYSWTKDGEQLSVGSNLLTDSRLAFLAPGLRPSAGSLAVKVTSRQNSGHYRCYLEENGRTLSLTQARLTVYQPLRIKILTGSSAADAEFSDEANNLTRFDYASQASLKCIVQGWPLHRISWLRNGQLLSNGADSGRVRLDPVSSETAAERGWSQLTVADFRLEDRGAYQCVAERLPTDRPVPADYATATLAVLIDDMPPVLVGTEPNTSYTPISLPEPASVDYHAPMAALTTGTFTCLFMAQPRPTVRAYLDGNQSLFDSLSNDLYYAHSSQQAPYKLTTQSVGQEVRVTLHYAPVSLQQTGRLVIEATNDRGSASCRLVLFGISNPPKLQIRTMRPRHYAVMGKSFTLECPVLGGLNIDESYPNKTDIETYRLRWLFRPAQSPTRVLVQPVTHRTMTGLNYPDQMRTLEVEPTDAGQYECVGTLVVDRNPENPTQLKAATEVSVVRGVRPNWVADQLDLDPDISITDACKPVNRPTGDWFAWWHKPGSSDAAGDFPAGLERREVGSEFVTYTAQQQMYAVESADDWLVSSQHQECYSRMREQFADAGFPNLLYSLSNRGLQRRAAMLNIRQPDRARDEGVFVCHIISCFDHAVAKKRVTFRRDFTFKKNEPPNTQEVALGQPITVPCAVSDTGRTSPQLVWYEGNSIREDARVPMYNASGPSRVSQFPNATLRINGVSLDDRSFLCAGFYRSVARSTTFNPVIRLPARVLPFDGEPRLEVAADSSVTIPCRTSGEQPMTVEWFAAYQAGGHTLCKVDGDCKQVGLFPEDHEYNSVPMSGYDPGYGASIGLTGFGSKTLELRRANSGLNGRYTCRASNRYNLISSSGKVAFVERSIEVVIVSPPGPVRSFQPTDAGADWVTLQWEPPTRTGHKPVTAYRVVYSYESGHELDPAGIPTETEAATTGADARSLTVRGLSPGRRLKFRISAVNSVGAGPSVTARVATLEKPPAGPVRNLRATAGRPIQDFSDDGDSVQLVISWDPPDAQLMNGRLTNYSVHYRQLELGDAPTECPAVLGVVGSGGGVAGVVVGASSGFVLAIRTPKLRTVIGGGGVGSRRRLRTLSDYQVKVTPANAVGEGPPACVLARTLGSAPLSPPSNVRCHAEGEDRIRVTWLPPDAESLNGRLVAYQLQHLQARDFSAQDESSAIETEVSSSQSQLVVTGLNPFTNYSFSMTVSNSKGRSPQSRPVAFCRTHSAAPSPPRDLRAFGVNSSAAALAWRRTDRPNGDLLRYDIEIVCDFGADSRFENNLSRIVPVSPAESTMTIISGLHSGATCRFRIRSVNTQLVGEFGTMIEYIASVGKQPLRVATLSTESRIFRGSSLTLDCAIVGEGSREPKWDGPPVDSSVKRILPNGSLLIESALSSGQYTCATADRSDHVSHNVEVFSPEMRPTPSPPQLLKGRVSLTSLEVLWRLGGTQAGPSASATTLEGARLTELELRYTNLYTGQTEARTLDLQPSNRSHLLDPVSCGAIVEFRARVVNAFGLRSAFAGPLRLQAPGAPPSPLSPGGWSSSLSASTGHSSIIRETAPGDVVLNLSAVFLPGFGCPAERFFVYAEGFGSSASSVPAAVVDLAKSASSDQDSSGSLRLSAGRLLALAHSLRLPLHQRSRMRLRVVAANAAGNSTSPALLDVALPPVPPPPMPVSPWPSAGDDLSGSSGSGLRHALLVICSVAIVAAILAVAIGLAFARGIGRSFFGCILCSPNNSPKPAAATATTSAASAAPNGEAGRMNGGGDDDADSVNSVDSRGELRFYACRIRPDPAEQLQQQPPFRLPCLVQRQQTQQTYLGAAEELAAASVYRGHGNGHYGGVGSSNGENGAPMIYGVRPQQQQQMLLAGSGPAVAYYGRGGFRRQLSDDSAQHTYQAIDYQQMSRYSLRASKSGGGGVGGVAKIGGDQREREAAAAASFSASGADSVYFTRSSSYAGGQVPAPAAMINSKLQIPLLKPPGQSSSSADYAGSVGYRVRQHRRSAGEGGQPDEDESRQQLLDANRFSAGAAETGIVSGGPSQSGIIKLRDPNYEEIFTVV